MILLLGGTSESGPVARMLLGMGHRVLVSTLTDLSLSLPEHERLERRAGRLGPEAMAALVRRGDVRLIVDATHPYAAEVSRTALAASEATGVLCVRLLRETAVAPAEDVTFADTHEEAARLACGDGRPVLLTVGTRNLAPYVEEAERRGGTLYARVLPTRGATEACARARIPPERRIAARGPFSVEQNRAHLRERDIGVLVTKDSGRAGGTPEKLHAARLAGCRIVVLRRPPAEGGHACHSIAELECEVRRLLDAVGENV